jgi:hypothetical protein
MKTLTVLLNSTQHEPQINLLSTSCLNVILTAADWDWVTFRLVAASSERLEVFEIVLKVICKRAKCIK